MANAVSRTFIDHLNHEIRSPLTVLVGMSEVLSLSSLTDDQRQCLAAMQQALGAVLSTLDSAVDYSRLNARSLALRNEPFSLKEVLAEVRQSRIRGERSPKTVLEVVIEEGVPDRLTGDAGRVRQALGSLIDHAVRVRALRQLELSVALRSEPDDRVELAFLLAEQGSPSAVGPNGNGRSEGYLACSEETLNGGSGYHLDLIVAAGLAALMNGRIWINPSREGIVSQFTARFGLRSERSAEETAAVVRAPRTRPGARRVLLAEDVRANQQLLASLLRARGHVVVTAGNGLEAVELFEAQPAHRRFDAVILDLEMPVMDGWRAAREIRELEERRQTRLVALSAHRVEGLAELLDDGHFDAAISKPVAAQQLYDVVESCSQSSIDRKDEDAEADASGGEALVDYEGALERLGGNEKLLDDLAQFFLEDSAELLSEARAAFARRDAKSLERAAHSIRGLASNFGAHRTVRAAVALEQLGRTGELAAAETACQELETEVGRLAKALEQRLSATVAREQDARGS